MKCTVGKRKERERNVQKKYCLITKEKKGKKMKVSKSVLIQFKLIIIKNPE